MLKVSSLPNILSTKNHSADFREFLLVFECFEQIREQMDKKRLLRFRGARRGLFSQGHDLP